MIQASIENTTGTQAAPVSTSPHDSFTSPHKCLLWEESLSPSTNEEMEAQRQKSEESCPRLTGQAGLIQAFPPPVDLAPSSSAHARPQDQGERQHSGSGSQAASRLRCSLSSKGLGQELLTADHCARLNSCNRVKMRISTSLYVDEETGGLGGHTLHCWALNVYLSIH